MIASLRIHRVDVALMGRPPREVAVRAVIFGDNPFVIIAPPHHSLAGLRGVSKERLVWNFLCASLDRARAWPSISI